MNQIDFISKKLLKTFPKSFKIFEESCQYSLDNSLDFIKGVLLNEEFLITYHNTESIRQQLFDYLNSLGYKFIVARHNGNFCTRDGYKIGLVFIIFISEGAWKAYNDENLRWNNWATHNSITAGPKPDRPIFNAIEYQNIYKSNQ